jgi:hypothetical protein
MELTFSRDFFNNRFLNNRFNHGFWYREDWFWFFLSVEKSDGNNKTQSIDIALCTELS